MTIWKFPLEFLEEQTIRMPPGAHVLTVQMQAGIPCLWAEVDDALGGAQDDRSFYIVGTGHPLPADRGRYIGTFQMHSGEFIFHVYQKLNASTKKENEG